MRVELKYKIEDIQLCKVLKTYGEIIVRLKAIEYKENFFCYWFSYLILSTRL